MYICITSQELGMYVCAYILCMCMCNYITICMVIFAGYC